MADQILASKIAANEQSEKKSDNKQDEQDTSKKTEPMPKWKKYGIAFMVVWFSSSLAYCIVAFSYPDMDEQGNYVEVGIRKLRVRTNLIIKTMEHNFSFVRLDLILTRPK